MTQKQFVLWMAMEDKKMRKADWDYYLNRGMMELLTPLLKARIGEDFTAYIKAEEKQAQSCNWMTYEAGRRLGEDIAVGRVRVDLKTAQASLERVVADVPEAKELTELRRRVQARAQGIHFKMYQGVAAEAWKYQQIRAALCGIQEGGIDMERIGELFGLR